MLYGWHISALQIYDKPRELSEQTAKQRKHQIMCAYDLAKFDLKLNQYYIDIIKATSFIACDVRKSPLSSMNGF